LPVYNEEALLLTNTEKLLSYLGSLATPFEILIGSNGSNDRTVELGEELQGRYLQVRFFHLLQQGPGAAFRRAVELMRHDALICLDMDLPVPLDFIAESLKLLEENDVVIGAKKLGIENRSWLRRLGSDCYIACAHRLTGLPYNDYSLGAKAYRKEVLNRYKMAIDRGTFYVQKIVYLAHRDGFRIMEFPVVCNDSRRSRFNLFHEGLYRFGRLFQLWLTSRAFSR
jgi:glycosyltransferase involved in cell wall biosynthesis